MAATFGGVCVFLAVLVAAQALPAKKHTEAAEATFDPMFPVNVSSEFQDLLNFPADFFRAMRKHMMSIIGDHSNRLTGDMRPGNNTIKHQVIDGHKFVINETTFEGKRGNGTDEGYFKVRVVDVHPESAETADNEIPGGKLQQQKRGVTRDLGNDLRVNEIAARDPHRIPEAYAEVFPLEIEVFERKPSTYATVHGSEATTDFDHPELDIEANFKNSKNAESLREPLFTSKKNLETLEGFDTPGTSKNRIDLPELPRFETLEIFDDPENHLNNLEKIRESHEAMHATLRNEFMRSHAEMTSKLGLGDPEYNKAFFTTPRSLWADISGLPAPFDTVDTSKSPEKNYLYDGATTDSTSFLLPEIIDVEHPDVFKTRFFGAKNAIRSGFSREKELGGKISEGLLEPIDLSRDIYVNELVKDKTPDPDSEFVDLTSMERR